MQNILTTEGDYSDLMRLGRGEKIARKQNVTDYLDLFTSLASLNDVIQHLVVFLFSYLSFLILSFTFAKLNTHECQMLILLP